MISSLTDAWRWYEGVRTLTRDMERLGRRYWENEFAEALGRDDRFRFVDSADIADRVGVIQGDVDDLGVLLLFSVFEAIVRDRARDDVERSLPKQLHPAVLHAVNELKKDMESGGFGKITEAYKTIDVNLIEEVNQVRRYRNWVAHGRRGDQPHRVDPLSAYDRLQRFLEKMSESLSEPLSGSSVIS